MSMNIQGTFRKHTFFFAALLIVGLGTFASCNPDDEEEPEDVVLKMASYQYNFHNGQTVPTAPYLGGHPSTLQASMTIDEMANGSSKITVEIENSVDSQVYMPMLLPMLLPRPMVRPIMKLLMEMFWLRW